MFSNFLAKTKESFSKKKIPLSQLIGIVGKIPGVGKAMVREAAKRSSQRHKCSECGVQAEVIVTHIIDDPHALLTDAGKQRLFAASEDVVATAPVDVPVALCGDSESAAVVDGQHPEGEATFDDAEIKELEDTISSELAACEDRAALGTTTTTTTTIDATVTVADDSEAVAEATPTAEATSATTATTLEATETPLSATTATASTAVVNTSTTSPAPATTSAAAANPFACAKCGGRLGVHCFPGDATNGNKRELMDKLFALFDAMPELIALKLPPSKVKSIQEEDIFWVN